MLSLGTVVGNEINLYLVCTSHSCEPMSVCDAFTFTITYTVGDLHPVINRYGFCVRVVYLLGLNLPRFLKLSDDGGFFQL